MSVIDVMPTGCRSGGETGFAKNETCFAPPKTFKKNIALLSVTRAANRLWRTKTAQWLADFSGRSLRSGQLLLAGRVAPSGEVLANLIRSDAGKVFLEEMMAPEFGPTPSWWADVELGLRLVDMERRAAADRAEMDRLRRQIDERPERS